jgi:redox-sensitive bicupin YhaK (pirin superfamily)
MRSSWSSSRACAIWATASPCAALCRTRSVNWSALSSSSIQMGPVQFLAGQGMDVRPHPHIGLATVTYLFDGRVMHRDSEGNALEITPGAMNLMTAGHGIAHSERTPESARHGHDGLFGIQSWIALPQAYEETDPSFQHFDAGELPVIEDGGVRARVIAGSAFGQKSPAGMFSGMALRGSAARAHRECPARSRSGGTGDLHCRRRDRHRRRGI